MDQGGFVVGAWPVGVVAWQLHIYRESASDTDRFGCC